MQNIDLLINIVIALILFGIGMSLKLYDFRQVILSKKELFIALVLQLIFLPILAFGIASFSTLSPAWKTGLFILAISPGGAMSNFISYLVKADVALSITLTTINSILILFTIPVLSNFALNHFMESTFSVEISMFSTWLHLLLILLLPAALGLGFNYFLPQFAKNLQKPLKLINAILLAVVFGVKFFASKQAGGSGIALQDLLALLPLVLVFHLISLLVSYFVALKFGIPRKQATTIGIETGMQNTTLALLITGTFIMNDEMSKPILVYAMFTFFSTTLFGLWGMKRFEPLKNESN